MKRHISISLRLTLWFSAISLCGFITFGALLLFTVGSSMNNVRDLKLRQRAEHVVEVVGSAHKNPDIIVPSADGHVLQVYVLGGKTLTREKLADAHFPWPAVPVGRAELRMSTRFNGQIYRIYVLTTSLNGVPLRVFVARILTDNPSLLDQPAWLLIRFMPAMLLVSALAGYFLSRRALDPVARLTASARSIRIGNLSRRLPTPQTGDELQDLADTCNEMLGRLEVAVNQITRFTADASHELRSPISYIRTVSECALQNPALDVESATSFHEIVRESGEASRLLDDMLSLARADSGHADVDFERLDLFKIFDEICGKARPFAEARMHSMTVHANCHTPVWIRGDVHSLRRLLWILLDNAIKYTPQRGQINVSLRTAGSEACISVQDTGIGIPDSEQLDIFRRFYRVDKARTLAEGTGLGLAIAKWISDIHGGVLSVESIEHSGSTFHVAFRLSA